MHTRPVRWLMTHPPGSQSCDSEQTPEKRIQQGTFIISTCASPDSAMSQCLKWIDAYFRPCTPANAISHLSGWLDLCSVWGWEEIMIGRNTQLFASKLPSETAATKEMVLLTYFVLSWACVYLFVFQITVYFLCFEHFTLLFRYELLDCTIIFTNSI